jgi:hypothetical protein
VPVLSAYSESTWTTNATTRSTGTLTWNTGDVIVTIAGSEGVGGGVPSVPTATGLTFTSIDNSGATGSICATRSSAATAASGGSSAITSTVTTSENFGIAAWVFSSAAGTGSHNEQHTATKTVANTRQADASAYVWGAFDFGAGATPAATPTPTNTRQAFQGTQYSVVIADLLPVSINQSYGLTGGSASGAFSILVVEILDTPAGALVRPAFAAIPFMR